MIEQLARTRQQCARIVPEQLGSERRKTFKPYDGVNSIFNLAYEVLSWKVQNALVKEDGAVPWLSAQHRNGKA